MDTAERLDRIKQNALQIAEDADVVKSSLSDKKPVMNLRGEVDGDRMFVTWESEYTGEFDLEWYNPKLGHAEFEHTRTRWSPDHLPRLEDKANNIGLWDRRDKTQDDHWLLRAVAPQFNFVSDPVNVKKKS